MVSKDIPSFCLVSVCVSPIVYCDLFGEASEGIACGTPTCCLLRSEVSVVITGAYATPMCEAAHADLIVYTNVNPSIHL